LFPQFVSQEFMQSFIGITPEYPRILTTVGAVTVSEEEMAKFDVDRKHLPLPAASGIRNFQEFSG
jgi:hypothetical protein